MSAEQTPTMTDEDAASLRGKLNAFAAGLTPGELTVLASLLERGSRQDDNDTSGYWWWFFQPQPYQPSRLMGDNGSGLISNNHNSFFGGYR